MKNDDDQGIRLDELEGRFVHAEQALQDLSDVIRMQWDEIDRLKELVRRLDESTSVLEHRQNLAAGAHSDKPPHY